MEVGWHACETGLDDEYTGSLRSMQSETFSQIKFIIFKAVPPNKLPFYLGSLSLLRIISSLFSHFGIYSQLDKKSKT